MIIKTVKAAKNGWLVNETINLKADFASEENKKDSVEEALSKYFADGNKAEPMFSLIEKSKTRKKIEIKLAKENQRNQGLKIENHTYFSAPLDLQKYEHAMKTGKRIALKSEVDWTEFIGTIKVHDGLIEVTGTVFDNALAELDLFLYRTWYKEQQLIQMISDAESLKAVESIVWE